jgi:hypothetical protein
VANVGPRWPSGWLARFKFDGWLPESQATTARVPGYPGQSAKRAPQCATDIGTLAGVNRVEGRFSVHTSTRTSANCITAKGLRVLSFQKDAKLARVFLRVPNGVAKSPKWAREPNVNVASDRGVDLALTFPTIRKPCEPLCLGD